MLCSFLRHVARSRALLGYGVFLAVATQGCKSRPVASKALVPQNTPVSLKPLQAATVQVNLDLRDAPDAELLIPRGITKPSPVVLVLGENATDLTSSCAKWGKMVGEGHFVLCQCASSEDLPVDARADAAEHALKAAMPGMRNFPQAYGAMLSAFDEWSAPPQTIVLRGAAEEIVDWQSLAFNRYAPHSLCFAIPAAEADLPGLLAERKPNTGVIAYVCVGTHCLPPAQSQQEFQLLLDV